MRCDLAYRLAVVDDQVNDLLLGQTGLGTKSRQRHVIPALALVLQVVSLAQPGVLEPKVSGQPAVEHFLGDARVDVDDQRLVREPLGPLARRLLLRFWIGDRYVVKVILEIREVVSPVRRRVESDALRIVRVFQFAVPGIRNTRAKSDNRSKAQPRCDARRRSRVCHRDTSSAVSFRSSASSKTYGSLKSHQACAPLPVAITTVGGMHSGMMEIASAMVAGSAFVCASDFKSRSAQKPLMPATSSDTQRCVGPQSALDRPTPTYTSRPRALSDELRSGGDVAVPVGTFILQRPDQDVHLLRLELPEEIEKVERRHALNSWRRPSPAACPD